MRHRRSARLRRWIWAVGSLVCLLIYGFRAVRPPHRTASGVERRLFGLGELSINLGQRPMDKVGVVQLVRLMESPSGGQWLIVPEDVDTGFGPGNGSPTGSPSLWERIQSFEWAPTAAPSRQLTTFWVTGTWELRGDRLSRIWSLPARGWRDEYRLWSAEGYGDALYLDLRTRRTIHPEWDQGPENLWYAQDNAIARFDQEGGSPDVDPTLTSALEELPADARRSYRYGHAFIGGRGVYLLYTLNPNEEPAALYAFSDEIAPRILRLAEKARPVALSHDGRLLFFERDGVLWRLDLRQPLPLLLDRLPVPELPDPLAAAGPGS
jgi:hypothetical protein